MRIYTSLPAEYINHAHIHFDGVGLQITLTGNYGVKTLRQVKNIVLHGGKRMTFFNVATGRSEDINCGSFGFSRDYSQYINNGEK